MKQYHDMLNYILENGYKKEDRTGTGTISVFGYQFRHDLNDGFPLLTTKKIHVKSIIHELLWFISGSTNIKYLNDNGVSIWDEWADEDGELGPVYGHQWRIWGEGWDSDFDQLGWAIREIKKDPNSRRLIVSAWNVMAIEEMALPPCHCFFQFYVNDDRLSCHMYQRSADVFLGVPFNIASYALLTMMVAQVCCLGLGDLVISYGDLHIYRNHVDQVCKQLTREPRELPEMVIRDRVNSIDDFRYTDFNLVNYDPHPGIKAEVAV